MLHLRTNAAERDERERERDRLHYVRSLRSTKRDLLSHFH
jgi:hypothetical protein